VPVASSTGKPTVLAGPDVFADDRGATMNADARSSADPTTMSSDLAEVAALVRRVVSRQLAERAAVDDIVQETLANVLAVRWRLDDCAVGPYAIVTARNLVASHWRRNGTRTRHEHRLLDPRTDDQPGDALIDSEEAAAVRVALTRLLPRERDVLVAHEVDGRDTKSLAADFKSTPGAVAAQLARSRAKLRVEYLIELEGEPPSAQCRPVLLSLSAGDRRRQAELDAGSHLLGCEFCGSLSAPLFDRPSEVEAACVPVRADPDIVTVRQRARELAVQAGFSATEATVIATAVSEIARNIVRFAGQGEVRLTIVVDGSTSGLMVIAEDSGPGIIDVELAMTAGYTTYGGRGLGLPGSRRLMDDFEVISEVGSGTTVTMTKWRRR
jgi:serine/threonine-protein kinase RsbT